jgi:8-oxo-dGTP pyrophosphatase MutT (NUDIX family)
MGAIFTPLSRDPFYVEVSRPPLDLATLAAIAAQDARIAADPHMFDGGATIVASIDGPQLNVYQGSFAELLAHEAICDENGFSPLGVGGLGACIVPVAPDSRTLWTKRGPRVLYPGTWQVGIAGGVDWGESTRDAALRELDEELGLRDLDPYPLGCCTGPDGIGAYVVYGVSLDPDVRLRPNEEIADSAWSADPTAQLAPLHAACLLIWNAIAAVRGLRAA